MIETANSRFVVLVTARIILGILRTDTFPGSNFRFASASLEFIVFSNPSEAFGKSDGTGGAGDGRKTGKSADF